MAEIEELNFINHLTWYQNYNPDLSAVNFSAWPSIKSKLLRCLKTLDSFDKHESSVVIENLVILRETTQRSRNEDQSQIFNILYKVSFYERLTKMIDHSDCTENLVLCNALSDLFICLAVKSRKVVHEILKSGSSQCANIFTKALKAPESFENVDSALLKQFHTSFLVSLILLVEKSRDHKEFFRMGCHKIVVGLMPQLHTEVHIFALFFLSSLSEANDRILGNIFKDCSRWIFCQIESLTKYVKVSLKLALKYRIAEKSRIPILKAIEMFAQNDSNAKAMIKKAKLLEKMTLLLRTRIKIVQHAALELLWEICFDEDNKDLIRKSSGLKEELEFIAGLSKSAVSRLAKNVMWELRSVCGYPNYSLLSADSAGEFYGDESQTLAEEIKQELTSIRVNIKYLNQKAIQMSICQLETIEEVKWRIQEIRQIQVADQTLVYDRCLLENSRSVSRYNIANGAVINLIPFNNQAPIDSVKPPTSPRKFSVACDLSEIGSSKASFKPHDTQSTLNLPIPGKGFERRSVACDEHLDDIPIVAERTPSLANPISTFKNRGHVMISYNWTHQNIALMLREGLEKEGVDVWIDVERMQGFMCQRMAEAVENAYAVIVCVSENYRTSHACRSEASYCFDLRKPIIPVIVEKGYFPQSGWLRLILANLLYYPLHNEQEYVKNFPRVLKVLRSSLHNEDIPDSSGHVETPSHSFNGMFENSESLVNVPSGLNIPTTQDFAGYSVDVTPTRDGNWNGGFRTRHISVGTPTGRNCVIS